MVFDWGTTPGLLARRMAALQAQQRAAGPEYELRISSDGGAEGELPARGLRVRHDATSARLGRVGQPWALGLSIGSVGCDRPALGAEARLSVTGKLAVSSRRLPEGSSYHAWYLSGPLGLEHGITLDERPLDCGGQGRLKIDVAFDQASARLDRSGKHALLRTSGGELFSYGELAAVDATGRVLESALRPHAQGLTLEIQLHDAQFPVYVDPLVTTAFDPLTADDAAFDENFAHAVAVSGDRIVVGAPFEDRPTLDDSGAAYVFVRDGNSWQQEAKLVASDAAIADRFGFAVAIDGDTIVVGATDDDAPDQAGSAYVFVRSGSSWSEQAKLRADLPSPSGQFGIAVALQGERAVVGAHTGGPVPSNGTFPGFVYVFQRTGSTWALETRLASASSVTSQFGSSVALDGDRIAVGAPYTAPGGSVHVFEHGSSWTLDQEILPAVGTTEARFGGSVALSGSLLLVGSPGLSANTGRVYAFEEASGSWGGETPIENPTAAGHFGTSVALRDGVALIGASFQLGGALLFQRQDEEWQAGPDLELPGFAGAGYSVALADGLAVVGVPGGMGAVHVFAVEDKLADGAACSSGAECASGNCSDAVCCATACGSSTDDCQACAIAAGALDDGECAMLPNTVTCRPSAGVCDVAESCDGSSTECPADTLASVGTPCDDGEVCTEDDTCNAGGSCTAGPSLSCADGNACTINSCTPGVGCSASNVPDGEPCSGGTCQAGACEAPDLELEPDAGGETVPDAGSDDAGSSAPDAGQSTPLDAGAAGSAAGEAGAAGSSGAGSGGGTSSGGASSSAGSGSGGAGSGGTGSGGTGSGGASGSVAAAGSGGGGSPGAGASGAGAAAGAGVPLGDDGCSCRVVAPSRPVSLWGLTALALAGVLRRRARRCA